MRAPGRWQANRSTASPDLRWPRRPVAKPVRVRWRFRCDPEWADRRRSLADGRLRLAEARREASWRRSTAGADKARSSRSGDATAIPGRNGEPSPKDARPSSSSATTGFIRVVRTPAGWRAGDRAYPRTARRRRPSTDDIYRRAAVAATGVALRLAGPLTPGTSSRQYRGLGCDTYHHKTVGASLWQASVSRDRARRGLSGSAWRRRCCA